MYYLYEPFGIPESNKYKTLDFDLAATEHHYVQVESKGTTFTNDEKVNSAKKSSLKTSIIKKKSDYPKTIKAKSKTKDRQDILIGIIGIMDKRTDSNALCYLVDPPVVNLDMPPRKYKLLSRLNFYYYLVNEVSPRSRLIPLLANRIKVLLKLEDYKSLSGANLIANIAGKKVNPGVFGNRSVIKTKSNYFNSEMNNIDVVGEVYHSIKSKEIIFSGFKYDVVDVLIGQDHNRILRFKKQESKSEGKLFIRVRKDHSIFIELKDNSTMRYKTKSNDFIELQLEGYFFHCKSGRVFGIIPYSS